MTIRKQTDRACLEMAHQYALHMSGCKKVAVGSMIVDKNKRVISFGANRAYPNFCKVNGCLREELYGNNDKTHRNPEDCRAIHSEIDAICSSSSDLTGCAIYVTRYPCEACARAIIASGMTKVVYGRETEISQATAVLFEAYDIKCYHYKDWVAEDVFN